MLLAIRSLAALEVEVRSPCTGGMGTSLVNDVDHLVACMLLAVRRLTAALYIEVGFLGASVVRATATLAVDADHAVFNMALAVCSFGAAIEAEARYPRASDD